MIHKTILRKPIIILIIIIIIFFNLTGCKDNTNHFEDTKFILGTVVSIKAFGEDAEIAVIKGFEKMEELEKTFDQYNQNSEISQVNKYFSDQNTNEKNPYKISKELCDVINLGLEYGDKTNGRYDITIGPLKKLWETKEKENALPLQNEIGEVKKLIDYKKVQLNVEQYTLYIEKGMLLDLGSIAKGYITEQAISTMKKNKINGAIINAGGNIVTIGNNIEDTWKIGITNPIELDSIIGYFSYKGEKAVVSSGNYLQYYLINDEKYGHILDLDTGWPYNEVIGISIIGNDSAVADVLSTAAYVAGIKEGLDLIKNADFEGLIIDNTEILHKTENLNNYFHERKKYK